MRVLSLFTGIGAHDLGFQRAGMQIVGQCECDPFCLRVLERHWPGLPRWNDVRDVSGAAVRERCGRVDLVTGGFPCTDISVAGKGRGIGTSAEPTDRSGLVWELLRVVSEVRPDWVVFENVPRLRTLGADTILGHMAEQAYTCWPIVVGAEHVGAPHRRHRVWIVGKLADAAQHGQRGQPATQWPDGQRTGQAGDVSGRLANDTAGRRESEQPTGYYERQGTSEGMQRSGTGAGFGSGGRDAPIGVAIAERTSPEVAEDLAQPSGTGLARRRDMPVGTGTQQPLSSGGGGTGGMAQPTGGGFGEGTGLRGDGEPRRGREPVGGDQDGRDTQLAHPKHDGLQGQSTAELRGEHDQVGRIQPTCNAGPASGSIRWPSRPGQPQHDWEEPRLIARFVESEVGIVVDGIAPGLVRLIAERHRLTPEAAEDWIRRNLYRVPGHWRRHALKAIGNANPPIVAEVVARAVMAAAEKIEQVGMAA